MKLTYLLLFTFITISLLSQPIQFEQTEIYSKEYPLTITAATTYYVNGANGSDTNDGSWGNPFATLWRACNESNNGDTIIMRGGTYTPTSYAALIDEGDATGAWLTIKNHTSETVIINGTNVPTISAYDAIIKISNTNSLRITGLTLNYSRVGGITLTEDCNNIRVDNCTISNCSAFAFKARADAGPPSSNITLDYNLFWGNENNWSGNTGQEVISFSTVTIFDIHHNTFRNNHYTNIDLKTSTGNGTVHHNDVNTTATKHNRYGTYYWGWTWFYIDARGRVNNVSVYNNIVVGNQTCVRLGSETSGGAVENITIYNNIFYYGGEGYAFAIGSTTTTNTLHKNISCYFNTFNSLGASFRILTYKEYYANILIQSNIMCNGYWSFRVVRINSTDNPNPINFDSNLFYRFGGVTHNEWADGTDKSWGTNSILGDPDFFNRSDYDYHLNSTSPAKDNGIDVGGITTDFDGNTRPQGSGFDQGAYEYIGPTVTTNASTGVEETNATLHGYLEDDGGEGCTVWFEYGTNLSYGETVYNNHTEGNYTGVSWDTSAHTANNNMGITMNDTHFWIVDQDNREVYKYYINGTYTGEHWDTSGHGSNPSGITTDGTNIWISDFANDNVYKYQMDGTYVNGWSTAPATWPMGVTTNGTYIWVGELSVGGSDVCKFNMDGTYTGETWDAVASISGMETDGTYIWTVDVTNAEIYKYEMDGTYISNWDTSEIGNGKPRGITVNDTQFWVLDSTDDEVYVYWRNISIEFETGDNFSIEIENLTPGQLYHYRAFANNSVETAYGNDSAFLTRPIIPSGLLISNASNPHVLQLSWTKGTGANNTYIERNTTANWERGNGTLVYNGTETSCDDSGLLKNTTYYYQMWSQSNWTYNPTLYSWSSSNASASASTTNASVPIVHTNASTDVEETDATLHGYLEDDGGEPCDVWFEYGTTTAYGSTVSTESYFWILDITDDEVYQYYANGTYTGTSWDIAGDGINNGIGIETNGTYIWIVDDSDDEVYLYYANGTYTGTHWDTSASGNGNPAGITTNGTYILITDFNDAEVYRYQMDGTYVDSWDTSGQVTFPVSIDTNDTYIWITTYTGDGHVYRYQMDGTYVDSWEDTGSEPYGITIFLDYIWIVDDNEDEVYKYQMDGTYTGTHWDTSTSGNGNPRGMTSYILSYNTSIASSGETFSGQATSLTPGQLYHYRAVANNSNATVNGSDMMLLTRPLIPSGYANITMVIDINVSWTKGTGANNTYIERNTTADWERGNGTLVYNDTGIYYYDDSTSETPLEQDTTYYYRLWSWSNWSWNATTNFSQFSDSSLLLSNTTIHVDPPYNGNRDYDGGTDTVNLTWTRGNYSDQDLVVKRNDTYAISPTQSGNWIRQNSTATYFNDSVTAGGFYTIFSWNETDRIYSLTGLNIPWGALYIGCFNESNMSEFITFDIEITDSEAQQSYVQEDITWWLYVDIYDIPYGEDTIFIFSATGYRQRTYYYDLVFNQLYNITAYLPPIEGPNGGGGEDCTLRLYTNSITITDPNSDATIVMTFEMDSISSVQIYNDSVWELVTEDNYSVVSNTIIINQSVLYDATTKAKVDYYYWDCEGEESILCQITILDSPYEQPITNAKCIVQRLTPETEEYVNVSVELTDGNGQFTIWLIPYVNYRFEITKEGMVQLGSKFWTPSPLEYIKTFKLEYIEEPDEQIWEGITYSIEPDFYDHYTNFTMYFNITSSDNQLEWFLIIVYYYNTTSEAWEQVYTENSSASGGGSLSYTTNQSLGKYGLECRFKKIGFDEYNFGIEQNPYIWEFILWSYIVGAGDLDDIIDNMLGYSPVHVGSTVVAWTSLGAAFASIFLFFQLSPKFAGMGIVIVGLVLAAFKNPLGIIGDDAITFATIGIIVILGILTWLVLRKKE